MISAAVWVARGVSKNVPEFYEPTEEEIAELVKKQQIAIDMLDQEDLKNNEEDEDEEDFDEGERSCLTLLVLAIAAFQSHTDCGSPHSTLVLRMMMRMMRIWRRRRLLLLRRKGRLLGWLPQMSRMMSRPRSSSRSSSLTSTMMSLKVCESIYLVWGVWG